MPVDKLGKLEVLAAKFGIRSFRENPSNIKENEIQVVFQMMK